MKYSFYVSDSFRAYSTFLGFLLIFSILAISAKGDPSVQPAPWNWVGLTGKNAEIIPVDPGSNPATQPLAYAPIFSTCRKNIMSYRFTVPEGTYKVRVHYLQASGQPTKNDSEISVVANGTTIVDKDPVWAPYRPWYSKTAKATDPVPNDVVPVVKEADVASKGGELIVLLPQNGASVTAIYGLEILGPKFSLRVNCGKKESFADKDGNTWVGDDDFCQPPPDQGEFAFTATDFKKGKWVNFSQDFLAQMGAQLGIRPLGESASEVYVIVNHDGGTFFVFSQIGIWKYDEASGRAVRADKGTFLGHPHAFGGIGVDLNPTGPGFYVYAWASAKDGTRTLDGVNFEPIVGNYPRQNGTDWVSADWMTDPNVVFISVHDVPGKTALSTDGGKTYHDVGDDGNNLAAIGAVGNKVLLKYLIDGALMRSVDLGLTWTKAADLKPKVPLKFTNYTPQGYISRLGKSIFLYTVKGDFYVSNDDGVSWKAVENTPAFTQPLVRGKTDQELVGFAGNAAYVSEDNGATWATTITEPAPGQPWVSSAGARARHAWGYDRIRDIFYYADAKGDIYRYEK